MIKLNIVLAIRNLIKRKLYSTANITGLSIGLFSFMCILMYYDHEHSFDKFHSKSESTYRLWDTFNSNSRQSAMMPFAWTQLLASEFSEIDVATSIQTIPCAVKMDGEVIKEQDVIAADSSFFDVFDFPILSGQSNELLVNPTGIVLEQKTAERYFTSALDAIGQQMTIGFQGNFNLYTVEAVVVCPSNSHIQFDFILPFAPIIRDHSNATAYQSYSTHFVYTYVIMTGSVNEQLLQSKFKEFLYKHGGEALRKKYTTSFQPLHEVYLKSNQEFDFNPRGSYENTQILSVVAWLILIISIVNFINLTTAQSIKRSSEIAIRKIFGSDRKKIVMQFLTESILISIAATVVSILGMMFLLPYINSLSGITFSLHHFLSPDRLFYAVGLGIGVGVLSGFYPALVISSFDPLLSLKSERIQNGSVVIARKSLVIFQFAMAMVLLIGTGVIASQLDFMQHSNLGIQTEQVLVIPDEGVVSNDAKAMKLLKNKMTALEEVVAVTATSTYPGVPSWSVGFIAEGSDEASNSLSCIFTDHDFAETYNISLLKGRDFDANIQSDAMGFLINEKAQELFASYDTTWWHAPIGKNIKSSFLNMEGPVIGVYKDFHFESFHTEIKPLILMVYPKFKSAVQLKLNTNEMAETLSGLESIWKELYPEVPFAYEFMDNVFETTYKSDQQMNKLFNVFSVIAILLAILGLYGLASYVAKDKLKNISIRKVLGASLPSLLYELGSGILTLGIVGAIIAMPIAYVLVNLWLETFPYRIDVPIDIFFYSFIMIIIILVITISYHALKTALSNPVKVLN
ncbi:MAG: ABC transporter permease [Reichenbachiella sp.]